MDSSHRTNPEGLAPRSSHAPVTVLNVSKHSTDNNNLKSQGLQKEELSPTPKKMPAKIVLPKDEDVVKKGATTNPTGTMAGNDDGFQDFLQRVAMVQQQEVFRRAVSQEHANQVPASPQRRRNSPSFTMLPEYAMYQEARYQRALSRGNSYNNLSLSPSSSPRSTTSPRVEWVPNPVAVQRAWDEHTLIARHAFPSSIFCGGQEDGGVPQPVPPSSPINDYIYPSYPNQSSSDLSDGVSFHDGGSASMPSAAALSAGSSSSWSEEDEHQAAVARQYLDFLGGISRDPSARSQQSRRYSNGSSNTNTTDNLVEIAPGVHEALRGAKETMRAVRVDFYAPVSCFGCSQEMFSIADAKYVICPECRVVSPIEEGAFDGKALEQHGVGLGFTCESLFQMQSEILSER